MKIDIYITKLYLKAMVAVYRFVITNAEVDCFHNQANTLYIN